MEVFASNLRKRAEELGLSNAEVARRLGLSERRYAHYVSGRNEPDLALLIRIAQILQTTPDALLGVEAARKGKSKRGLLMERLAAAADTMTDSDLEAAVVQVQAVAALRRR